MKYLRQMNLTPTNDHDAEECQFPRGIRRRLHEYSHHDQLTRAVFISAEAQGLSGEDTMTLLAFEALKRLQILEDRQIDIAMRSPTPTLIFNDELQEQRQRSGK
jgi:hypothetical protein